VKWWQFFLSPLGLLYGFVLSVRNQLFDVGLLSSYKSKTPIIGIGNLSVGGTGKTPFTAYLIEQLHQQGKTIAVVSRGYGRETKGLLKVQEESAANKVGDEPLLLKRRYPHAHVWVSEKREWGVKEAEKEGVDVILLDDNFQHRSVHVDYQFMLSKFKAPFFKDYPMPAGRLREFRNGAKRADSLIFTGVSALTEQQETQYKQKTKEYSTCKVSFAAHKPRPLVWVGAVPIKLNQVLAVSGIANPLGFIAFCESMANSVVPLSYRDHKKYTERDLNYMLNMLKSFKSNSALICTEKDWVKLKDMFTTEQKSNLHIAFLPVDIKLSDNYATQQMLEIINNKAHD